MRSNREEVNDNILQQFQCLGFLKNFLKDFIYFQREGKGGRKRGRETSVVCLLHALTWGPIPQPSRVPWLGVKLATLRFVGRCPTHWARQARAVLLNYCCLAIVLFWQRKPALFYFFRGVQGPSAGVFVHSLGMYHKGGSQGKCAPESSSVIFQRNDFVWQN